LKLKISRNRENTEANLKMNAFEALKSLREHRKHGNRSKEERISKSAETEKP
jgi:hypothetical protein